MCVEGETTNCGHGCPFALHLAYVNLGTTHAYLGGPVIHSPAQFLDILPAAVRVFSNRLVVQSAHTRCNFNRRFAASIILAVPTTGRSALYNSVRSLLSCCLFQRKSG